MDNFQNHIICKRRLSLSQYYFFICLVFFSLSFISYPQNRDYEVEYITTKDGLVHGCIQHIMQDSKGFLWFATEGGLNRYDGYNIKLYDCGQSFITTIFEDPADSGNALWIGTRNGGLFKFNCETERFIQFQQDSDDSNSISNNYIHSIYKVRDSTYWIGTSGGGLNSFDSKTGKFVSYRHNPNDTTSISRDFITSICEDYNDNLWIGTEENLNRFNRHTKKFMKYVHDYSVAPEPPYLFSIHSIYEDSENTLWVGTNSGLLKYDRENDQFIGLNIAKEDKTFFDFTSVFSITEDKEKTLWFSSNPEGLIGIPSERNNVRYISKELNTLSTSSVCADNSGIIWVGTWCKGINKIIPRNKYFNHYKLTDSNNSGFDWTYSFFEDMNDNLWIGTNRGLLKIINGNLNHYPILVDGYESLVYQIVKSENNKVWLICEGTLIEFDSETKNYINYGRYAKYPRQVDKFILSLEKDSSEIASIKRVTSNQFITKKFTIDKSTPVIVFCTGEGNLSELVDYGWITKEEDDSAVWKMNPKSSRIMNREFKNRYQISLLTLNTGTYRMHYQTNDEHAFDDWIGEAPRNITGTRHIADLYGISVFPISISDFQKYKSEIDKIAYIGFAYSEIESPVVDDEGRLWIALLTEPNTVHFFDRETKQCVPYEIMVNNRLIRNITSIFKDHSGNLWFVSSESVLIRRNVNGTCEVKFDLNDYIEDKKVNLSKSAIHQVFVDSKGNFWIGSEIGLTNFNPINEKTEHYNLAAFSLPNIIEAIIEDDKGKLWISTGKNLSKFDPGENKIQEYNERDGLPTIKFASQSAFKFKDGQLAFGGSNGFIMFHPDSIKNNEIPPEIAITGFQIFNKPISIGQNSPLNKAITHSDKIVLNYDQDVFTFEFAALDYTDPDRNKYAYKMEGVDPDWVYTDANRRYATYTNLDPGSYVFTVKGSNNDGIWNEEGKSILVIITPPWWATTWAYILYAFILISVIYFTWKMQLKRIRIKHDYEMSKFEAEKMHEVDEMKSRFFANISHEFRTPLTLIVGPAEKISKHESESPEKDANIIKRNSKRLLKLVNQLLDLSRLDSGKLKLEASPGNIVTFIKGVALSFESLSESKDIILKIKSSSDLIEVYFDREKMMDIMSNLLSNAFKFTPIGGKIFIAIDDTSNDTVEIKIKNTGIGIPQEELTKLFDRFYQVDSTHTKEHEGTGIGLALTKELVELHHGSIRVDSEVDNWTEFTINLPLSREHLKDEEIITTDETIYQKGIPVEEEEYYESAAIAEIDAITDEGKTVILVVEDNYDMREYIKESLSDDYEVEEAVNGEQGVRIAKRIIPDLIISDLMMPKMDGNELTRILKNDERTSHIPIIILTAKSGQENKIEGLETGADDYLTKPFDLQELRVRVENLISIRKKLQEKFSKGDFLYKPSGEKIKSIDEKFLAKVIKVLENHLSEEDFSIEKCGSEVGMSRTHLYKKIKALVGKSPSQYIRSVRLNYAKKMVEEGKGNISEIAYSVGFSSPAYFSRCFKEEFGYPPSEIIN